MARLTKHLSAGFLLMLSGISAGHAATTDMKATIVDGNCQVAVDTPSITFDNRDVSQFSSGTAAVLPLNVNLNCEGMQGNAPSLTVSGESSQLSDNRLFRAASSTAEFVGFMLKKGVLNNLSDFYNATGTVAPGDTVALTQDDGNFMQPFSVGLVQGAGDPPLKPGAVTAKITFAFIFP
jgi:type 1 fimbria pilin